MTTVQQLFIFDVGTTLVIGTAKKLAAAMRKTGVQRRHFALMSKRVLKTRSGPMTIYAFWANEAPIIRAIAVIHARDHGYVGELVYRRPPTGVAYELDAILRSFTSR